MICNAGPVAALIGGEIGFCPGDGVLDVLPALDGVVGRVAFGFFTLFCFG